MDTLFLYTDTTVIRELKFKCKFYESVYIDALPLLDWKVNSTFICISTW